MSKFKAGDKVVRIVNIDPYFTVDTMYTIAYEINDNYISLDAMPNSGLWAAKYFDLAPTQTTNGYKNDDNKVRMDLIPPEVMFALGSILTHGATKYSDRNWEAGMAYSRVFAAAMRHAWAWFGGNGPSSTNFVFGTNDDDDSKYSHLWHLLACVTFLVTYEERKMDNNDDRPNWKDLV